jgi:hypothetical protein
MANFEAQIEWTDGDGGKPKRTYYLVAADRAAALTRLETMAELADLVTLGAITGVWLKESVDISAWTLKSSADGDKEIKGVFKGRVTGNFDYETSLPTFDITNFTSPGGGINIGSGATQNFVNELVSGGWADYRHTDVIAIDSGNEKIG